MTQAANTVATGGRGAMNFYDGEPAEGDQGTETGFWSAGGLRAPYFVRPCRKRFDLYQLSATLPSQGWHKEILMAQVETDTTDVLPEPGRKKKNPRELDKLLDEGIEESMDASDPPAAVQPEVHMEPDREKVDPDAGDDKSKH